MDGYIVLLYYGQINCETVYDIDLLLNGFIYPDSHS